MLGVVGMLIGLMAGALLIVSAVHASTRARTAADLAALAAADRVLNPRPGEHPCMAADRLARRNGGLLIACATGPDEVTVEVGVRASGPGLGRATARSRAGLSP